MPDDTRFPEQQDEGFWRRFGPTIRSILLTMTLVTIIGVQWILTLRENERLKEEIEWLKVENDGLKNQLKQRK